MTEDIKFGPAMAALNERQRAFVVAMLERPGCSFSQAAKIAGYADPGKHSSSIRVQAHTLAHHPGVQAAIREEAGKRLNAASLMAANALIAVLDDKKAEQKDKIKAAGMLLDRTGFAAAQNINVNKIVTDQSGKAIMERIERAAAALGVDPAQLLGLEPMKVIQHQDRADEPTQS